jgi:DNA-binding NarL/FixJ family response regulator
VRAVIAEDQFLLRDGLTRMLHAHGFDITAAVDNGADLLAAVIADPPDVAIIDVRLPPTFTDEGMRAALTARRELPGLSVLVLSQYVEQLYARELLAGCRGGIGYLLKDRVPRQRAVHRRGPQGGGGRYRDGPGSDRPAAAAELGRRRPDRAQSA